MAVIAPQTAPNFATGEYHRINKIEFLCFPVAPDHPNPPQPTLQVHVGFYFNAEARNANPQNPMWTNVVTFQEADLPQDLREMVYGLLMKSPLFAGTNAASDVPASAPATSGTVTATSP